MVHQDQKNVNGVVQRLLIFNEVANFGSFTFSSDQHLVSLIRRKYSL